MKYRLTANGISFDFHDMSGVSLSIAILKRFNIEYKLEEL